MVVRNEYGIKKNHKKNTEVDPFCFLSERETNHYMSFLTINFPNKGQNAVDKVDRAKAAAWLSISTRLVDIEIGLN